MKSFILSLLCPLIFAYPYPTEHIYPGHNVWPKPINQKFNSKYISIRPTTIIYNVDHCDSINSAYYRFLEQIKDHETFSNQIFFTNKTYNLVDLQVEYESCENYPHAEMDEKYWIEVTEKTIKISAASNWGIIHGFTTLNQLVWSDNDPLQSKSSIPPRYENLNLTSITDYPFLKYRGVMIDSARHFLPIKIIKRQLEIMSINKFNVLHWHLTDDESFPYRSETFPQLLNPWRDDAVYTKAELIDLIDFAANLGIRIIPEIDTPGHTNSWKNVSPDFTSKCDKFQDNAGYTKPLNPAIEGNYQILTGLFAEFRSIFKDKLIHIGGDEVSMDCWDYDPEVKKLKQKLNLHSNSEVEKYYVERLLKIVNQNKFTPIAWEEVYENQDNLSKEVIVEVWKSWTYTQVLPRILNSGQSVILSAPWYLDLIVYGEDRSWKRYYNEKLDPRLYGGEACIWAEFVDETNLESQLWPMASAIAERIWSNPKELNPKEMTRARLGYFRCYLRSLGFEPKPLFPNQVCDYSQTDVFEELDWLDERL